MVRASNIPRVSAKHRWSRVVWLLSVVIIALIGLMRWGGYLLISSDPLPAHVDAAVVLQGSVQGEIARVAGAVQLLRQGVTGRALLSVPEVSYWGEPVPQAARAYIQRTYGSDVADRFIFCETPTGVDSTLQESEAVLPCIQAHGWHTIAVVTSNYHTRRAGRIWRRVLKPAQPPILIWMDGVGDPEFQPQGWWRRRIWAKTWFYEFTKLVSEAV